MSSLGRAASGRIRQVTGLEPALPLPRLHYLYASLAGFDALAPGQKSGREILPDLMD